MTKVMKTVLVILLVIVVGCGALAWYLIGSMRSGTVDTVQAPEGVMDQTDELEAEAEPSVEPSVVTVVAGEATPEPTLQPTPMPIYEQENAEDAIVNILLVGTDSRSKEQDAQGRSDTMMLASLDKEKGTVKLVSFMRDARVKRMGQSGRFTFYNKLNGAYRGGYGGGGPGELINTLNYNFDLDIQQYVCVGFDGFAVLIDKIGGLDVELDQKEINFINDRIKGEHELEPDIVKNAATLKAEPGLVHLNGVQALIHARNRHTGVDGGEGNDFDRVNRQQEIIKLVYQKVAKEMNVSSITGLITFATDYITTNMDLATMTSLATVLLQNEISFSSTTIPEEGTYKSWVDDKSGEKTDQLEFNLKKTTASLKTLLYGADAAEATPAAE